MRKCNRLCTKVIDFNILPWEEYLFHFAFLKWPQHRFSVMDEVRDNVFRRTAFSTFLRKFLLELRDGQGRPALHTYVAVDEGTVLQFLALIPRDSPDVPDLFRATDGTGKNALH